MIDPTPPPSHAERRSSVTVADGALVRLIHADLFGRAKSKQFPTDVLATMDGAAYCMSSLAETLAGDPLTGGTFPADRGHPDMTAQPDPATLRHVPWELDTSWMLADLLDDSLGAHRPHTLCQRHAVRSAVAALAEAGYTADVAAELEFYLLESDGRSPARLYSDADGMVYTSGRRADPRGVIATLQRNLRAIGLPVTAAGREFSPGQFEVNLAHRDPVSAADDAFLFKEAVKDISAAHGLLAVFMAKPFDAHSGSSMHLHLSLSNGGVNAFADDGRLRQRFINGIVRHAPALTAFASSTVNSYKRLNGGGVVARTAVVGEDDRDCWIRIPRDGGASSRLEWRGGDAASNPYLLIAATIHAGLDGLADDRPATEGAMLPTSLEAAVDALAANTWLRECLGEELVTTFCALKHDEATRFARAVTDWEWNTYHLHA